MTVRMMIFEMLQVEQLPIIHKWVQNENEIRQYAKVYNVSLMSTSHQVKRCCNFAMKAAEQGVLLVLQSKVCDWRSSVLSSVFYKYVASLSCYPSVYIRTYNI